MGTFGTKYPEYKPWKVSPIGTFGVKVQKPQTPMDMVGLRGLHKFYDGIMGLFEKPEPRHPPKRKPEREPAWFKDRHCTMAQFKEKHGK